MYVYICAVGRPLSSPAGSTSKAFAKVCCPSCWQTWIVSIHLYDSDSHVRNNKAYKLFSAKWVILSWGINVLVLGYPLNPWRPRSKPVVVSEFVDWSALTVCVVFLTTFILPPWWEGAVGESDATVCTDHMFPHFHVHVNNLSEQGGLPDRKLGKSPRFYMNAKQCAHFNKTLCFSA